MHIINTIIHSINPLILNVFNQNLLLKCNISTNFHCFSLAVINFNVSRSIHVFVYFESNASPNIPSEPACIGETIPCCPSCPIVSAASFADPTAAVCLCLAIVWPSPSRSLLINCRCEWWQHCLTLGEPAQKYISTTATTTTTITSCAMQTTHPQE